MSDGPRGGRRRSVGLQADVYPEGAALTVVGVDADAPRLSEVVYLTWPKYRFALIQLLQVK